VPPSTPGVDEPVNGANRPCSSEIGACQIGVQIYQDGVWGECIGAVFPTAEICDGVDNNCDGVIDEGSACSALSAPAATSTEPIIEIPIATSTEPIIEPQPEPIIISTSTEPIIISTSTEPIATSTTP
ncbi:MAG: putative metal-binding motif-containing protein, partial [bacterium]|nr:putative metal-binding motif-containing protein [bacterium]